MITTETRENRFDLILPRSGARFTFRYLSVRQFRRAAALFDGLQQVTTPEQALGAMIQLLTMGLCGWSSVTSDDPELLAEAGLDPTAGAAALPFKPDLLDAVLRLSEMNQLCEAFMREQNPPAASLGNSGSPASSPQAPSAPIASAAAAVNLARA